MENKISTCSKLMAEQGLTIAFAESATAGWLCSEFALTEESGKVLKGGIACVMGIGTVMNLKTATNQIMGGMIFGICMALMENTQYDPNNGRVVTRDLAQYLVPVHADIPEIEVQFIGKPDPFISPIGARGIGEIGITGITAAIANAIYNATGKRVRDLPITPDKLIA